MGDEGVDRAAAARAMQTLRVAIGRGGSVTVGDATYSVMRVYPSASYPYSGETFHALVRTDAGGNHVVLETLRRNGVSLGTSLRVLTRDTSGAATKVLAPYSAEAQLETMKAVDAILEMVEAPLHADARAYVAALEKAQRGWHVPTEIPRVPEAVGTTSEERIDNIAHLRQTLPLLEEIAQTTADVVAHGLLGAVIEQPEIISALRERGYDVGTITAAYSRMSESYEAAAPALVKGVSPVCSAPKFDPADPAAHLVDSPRPSKTHVLGFLSDSAALRQLVGESKPSITYFHEDLDAIREALRRTGPLKIGRAHYEVRTVAGIGPGMSKPEQFEALFRVTPRDQRLPAALAWPTLVTCYVGDDADHVPTAVTSTMDAHTAQRLYGCSQRPGENGQATCVDVVATEPTPAVELAAKDAAAIARTAYAQVEQEFTARRALLEMSPSESAQAEMKEADSFLVVPAARMSAHELVGCMESTEKALRFINAAVVREAGNSVAAIRRLLDDHRGLFMAAAQIGNGYRVREFVAMYSFGDNRPEVEYHASLLTYGNEIVERPPATHPAYPATQLVGGWPVAISDEAAERLIRDAATLAGVVKKPPSTPSAGLDL